MRQYRLYLSVYSEREEIEQNYIQITEPLKYYNDFSKWEMLFNIMRQLGLKYGKENINC